MNDQKLVYLTRRQAEVVQLKESIEKNSFELAQTLGHRLKGHGDTFGFPEISSLGVTLEQAAKEKDIDRLKAVVKTLDERVEENIKTIKGA